MNVRAPEHGQGFLGWPFAELRRTFAELGATPVLYAAKTGFAAGVSWFIAADLLGNQFPVFAPLAALLTVQVTIWESVSRGLQRVLGVVVGVLVALGFARLAGIHAWSIALLIFISLLAGRALRLGVQGSVQVPVSALLVLVLGATTGSYGLDRVVDTAIGAACGIGVNLVLFPPTNLERAQVAVAEFARSLAKLLRGMSGTVAEAVPGMRDENLATARRLSEEVTTADDMVAHAEEGTRWHPSGRHQRSVIFGLVGAMATLHLVERQVRGIARSIAEAPKGERFPREVSAALAELLHEVADELETWAWATPSTSSDAAAGALGELISGPSPMRNTASEMYERLLSALHGSSLSPLAAASVTAAAVDAHRIAEEIHEEAPPGLTRSPRWRTLFGPPG
ncbi:MAG TPA: FUSC family protein [Acidimicrobiales bacterium]|nr:FUSC family protein [Acidimicrobiales bacterium]